MYLKSIKIEQKSFKNFSTRRTFVTLVYNNKIKQQMQTVIKNIAKFNAIVINDWFNAYDDFLQASK